MTVKRLLNVIFGTLSMLQAFDKCYRSNSSLIEIFYRGTLSVLQASHKCYRSNSILIDIFCRDN